MKKIDKCLLASMICLSYSLLVIFYFGYITYILKSYNKSSLLGLSVTIMWVIGYLCYRKSGKDNKNNYVDDVMYDPDKKKFIRNKVVLITAIILAVVLVGVFYPLIFM